MSNSDLMSRLVGYSTESEEAGDLVELSSDILNAAGEEEAELVELSSEINQAGRNIVAMEAMTRSFTSNKEITAENYTQYVASLEALAIAANLPMTGRSLAPEYSVEGGKTTYEYSIEAEEKSKGLIARIWEWIKEKWAQLVAWFKRVILRQKEQKEAVVKKADEAITEVKAKEEAGAPEVTDSIVLPASAARYLIDAAGNPVGLQKAIGTVVSTAKAGDAAAKAWIGYVDAGHQLKIGEMNKFAKVGEVPTMIGSKMVVTPGADKKMPCVGMTVKFVTPELKDGTVFAPLKRGEVIRGLEAVKESIKTSYGAKKIEELNKLFDQAALSAAAGTVGHGADEAERMNRVKGAIATFMATVHALSRDHTALALKTHMAVVTYAKVLNGGTAAVKPNLPK